MRKRKQRRRRHKRNERFATFNLRGLSTTKFAFLDSDLIKYNILICGLQETKHTKLQTKTSKKYKYIFFEQKNGIHGGIGFAIRKDIYYLIDNIKQYSDRVATMTCTLLNNKVHFIVAYAPTLVRSENPRAADLEIHPSGLRGQFYDTLNKAVSDIPNRQELWILGDMNAKVGGGPDYMSDCMGRWSKGKRNANGQWLIDFATQHKLFLTNTAFKNKAGRIKTWRSISKFAKRPPLRRNGQIIRDENGKAIRKKKMVFAYNQIDYIICRQHCRNRIQNARSYPATATPSDHTLVICTANVHRKNKRFLSQKEKKIEPQIDINSLSKHAEAFANLAQSELPEIDTTKPMSTWDNLCKFLTNCAERTVGFKPKRKHGMKHWISDPTCAKLSREQIKLGERWHRETNLTRRKEIRKARNSKLRELHSAIKVAYTNHLTKFAEQIESIRNDARKMAQSMRFFKREIQRTPNLRVCDENGKLLTKENDQAKIISKHFEMQFNTDIARNYINESVAPLTITKDDIYSIVTDLANGKAAGTDKLPSELLKYSLSKQTIECDDGTETYDIDNCKVTSWLYAYITNLLSRPACEIDSYIGKGRLAALHKPGKPLGPATSLRPISVLTSLRKIISIYTLRKAKQKGIYDALPASQHAFRAGHSTGDVLFAHRILCNLALCSEFKYWLMSIDMSKAFDTPSRAALFEAFAEATNQDAELKYLASILLSNTSLSLRIKQHTEQPFSTNVGTPQGDSFSPLLFNIYFESVMKITRNAPFWPKETEFDAKHSIPAELQYADDLDFISTSKAVLDSKMQAMLALFPSLYLRLNQSKTKYAEIRRENEDERDERIQCDWRNNKILGSLLCPIKDIKQRCALAGTIFRKLYGYLKNKGSNLETRIRQFRIHIESIVLYNIGCAGLTKSEWGKLNSKQYRYYCSIIGVHWPEKISIVDCFDKVKCPRWKTIADFRRWTMFGHILRKGQASPAKKALRFCMRVTKHDYTWRFQTAGLFMQLKKDFKFAYNTKLEGIITLNNLENASQYRNHWKRISYEMACLLNPTDRFAHYLIKNTKWNERVPKDNSINVNALTPYIQASMIPPPLENV